MTVPPPKYHAQREWWLASRRSQRWADRARHHAEQDRRITRFGTLFMALAATAIILTGVVFPHWIGWAA